MNPDEACLDAAATRLRQHEEMICRIWHGRTPRHKADAYASFLAARAIPDYRAVAGNLAAHVLRRDEGDIAHFPTVTFWQSEDAIRDFAGDQLLTARHYPEDRNYLLEFEPWVQHFQVTAEAHSNVRPLL